MFASLPRTARLATLRLASSSICKTLPSALKLVHRAAPLLQQQRAFAISSFLRQEIATASEQTTVLDDAEHEVKVSEDEVTRFQDLADKGLIDAKIISNITKGLKYDEMTKVQRKTVTSTVQGDDVLAQAKTGTGKTIAFLLPVLQRLLTSPEPLQPRSLDIRAIIISPTRELASQIYNDALKLSTGTKVLTQCAVGGNRKREAVFQMKKEGCHLLIATPGRLFDLLSDQFLRLDLSKVDTLVLDEGDTLLDQGFSEEIDRIVALLPKSQSSVRGGTGRQSLIFSATMPQKVLAMVQKTLRRDYKFLKMIEKNESATHTKIKQHIVTCRGWENLLPSIYELAMRETSPEAAEEAVEQIEKDIEMTIAEKEPFKAIVFFPTAKFAALAAATFRNLQHEDGGRHPLMQRTRVIEIHSRLTQAARTRAAENFRNSKSAILFSTDVVARGMDFPKVTHVIQVGTPKNQEQYVHRIGRTGRAGREGTGYLFLTQEETRSQDVRAILKGLPLNPDKTISSAPIDLSAEQDLAKHTADALTAVSAAGHSLDESIKSGTYLSLLGYYTGMISDRQVLVDKLNTWSSVGWGLAEPPAITSKLAQLLGLNRVRGLRLGSPPADFGDRQFGGRPPRRDFGGPPRGGFGGDRPPRRDFGAPRSFGDRPPRAFGDRPPRSDFGGDRPPRRDFGDRPPRSDFGGDRPPRRDFGDRPPRSDFGGDRPPRRDFGDRPPRRDFGDKPSFGGDRPPRRDFGDRPQRSFQDRNRAPWMGRGGTTTPKPRRHSFS